MPICKDLPSPQLLHQVHVIGPQNVLHKYEPFLLNTPISMLLYLLSSIIVTASSSVIYMYGYQKFMAFISQEREKQARNGEMKLGICMDWGNSNMK